MALHEPHRTDLVEVNRTTLRIWEWGDPADPPVICAHGAYDHGRMFDELAPMLATRGLRVIAPDLRGHGDSGRLASGHVWMASALDLVMLARWLGGPVGLVGHSFGGGLALFVAAMWPEQVRWVIDLDGLGPPSDGFEDEVDLAAAAAAGFDAIERVDTAPPRVYPSLADMAERRRRINVRLPDGWIEHLTRHGAVETEGGWMWKADPMFNIGFPDDFDLDMLLAQYALISAPTLVLTGAEPDTWSDLSDADIAVRVAAIGASHQAIADAGHYVHCEQPAAVMTAIGSFLDEVGP